MERTISTMVENKHILAPVVSPTWAVGDCFKVLIDGVAMIAMLTDEDEVVVILTGDLRGESHDTSDLDDYLLRENHILDLSIVI